jgi:hypothetical protein
MFRQDPEIDRGTPTRGRREGKYALPSEAVAEAIRRDIALHVEPDPHAADRPHPRYELISLYLDTPALDFYLDTVHGEKNRHKLRVRVYTDRPVAPAFFEVKSKVGDVIRKRRARVRPEVVGALLRGARPRRCHLVGESTSDLADLLYFRDLMDLGQATPRMRVRYTREAWVDRNDRDLRITFDRDLMCSPTDSTDVVGARDLWFKVTRLPVILEIKFNDRYPSWVSDLIRRFNLTRTSIPKYVMSTDVTSRLAIGPGNASGRVVQ